MNIKKQSPTIRSYGTPSVFKGTTYWHVVDGKWYYGKENSNINAVDNFAETSTLPGLIQVARSFQENLELLNNRINTIHKELSYWDLYKITHSIENETTFPSTISALAPGESAVINTPESFSYNGEQYRRGDVVVKLNDSQEILIKAQNTGVYIPKTVIPSQEGQSGTYTIVYEYAAAVTPENKEKSFDVAFANSYTYGNIGELTASATSFTFGKQTYNGEVVEPLIKLFYNNEEIITDLCELTSVGTNFCFSITDTISDFLPTGRSITIQVK